MHGVAGCTSASPDIIAHGNPQHLSQHRSEAHLQAKYAREWEHEQADPEDRKVVAEEVHAAEAEGFQAIARWVTDCVCTSLF
jgi:hypothetical protein